MSPGMKTVQNSLSRIARDGWLLPVPHGFLRIFTAYFFDFSTISFACS